MTHVRLGRVSQTWRLNLSTLLASEERRAPRTEECGFDPGHGEQSVVHLSLLTAGRYYLLTLNSKVCTRKCTCDWVCKLPKGLKHACWIFTTETVLQALRERHACRILTTETLLQTICEAFFSFSFFSFSFSFLFCDLMTIVRPGMVLNVWFKKKKSDDDVELHVLGCRLTY